MFGSMIVLHIFVDLMRIDLKQIFRSRRQDVRVLTLAQCMAPKVALGVKVSRRSEAAVP